MATIFEPKRISDWLKGEDISPTSYSRDQVTLLSLTSAQALTTGMILGKVTSTGKYTPLNTSAPVAVLSGATVGSISGGGSGWSSTPPTVAITGGGGTGATATAAVNGDGTLTFTVTGAGSGFTSTPTVALSGGTQNGSQNAAAILYLDTVVPAGVDTQATVITRHAAVMDIGLTYPANITAAQVATVVGQLQSAGILVRRGA